RDLSGVLRAEFPLRPQAREVAELLLGPPLRVPGEAQKELDWELHRLEVADVGDPDAVGAVGFRQRHLLPDFRDRIGVDPLVVARTADVIEVVVDAGSARTLALLGG